MFHFKFLLLSPLDARPEKEEGSRNENQNKTTATLKKQPRNLLKLRDFRSSDRFGAPHLNLRERLGNKREKKRLGSVISGMDKIFEGMKLHTLAVKINLHITRLSEEYKFSPVK